MPLQNRVTPTGELIAVEDRGTLLGNRGVLHDERRRIVRLAQVRRWIICVLEFRGRHRPVMNPRRYTELFFLDEAVALAAGHRPCCKCRYSDYQWFRRLWRETKKLPELPRAETMDDVLHEERRMVDGRRRTRLADPATLPDGVMILDEDQPWLLRRSELLRWTPAGYAERRALPGTAVAVLTPPATVATIAAGFTPMLHPSAD
ncbi:MAG TPA: hypothetical protein VLJ59_20510 [Mycobacteriales bacterium]|nr:hypothetical protein [Mycobacteriales bacterium]